MSSGIPLCEICGARQAKYVCQRCGALVCEHHFEWTEGLCSNCLKEAIGERVLTGRKIVHSYTLPMLLLIIGFLVVFIGFATLMLSPFILPGNATTTVGGIVLIGPLPIMFGYGREITLLIVILAVIAVIIILLQLLLMRRTVR